ncbi:amidase [Streptomyces monticola]|uniref:Amidase n=1 Tax=Streptomyces monticola TaxID=2666263 RepID=A0ABW2JKF5_9ACTN
MDAAGTDAAGTDAGNAAADAMDGSGGDRSGGDGSGGDGSGGDGLGGDGLALAAAVRKGEVSPVELVERGLRLIEAYDDRLGAFVTVTAEPALAEARAAERRIAADGPEGLPPFFGVPTAVKDLTPTAGIRTTFGSRVYADHVPDADAHSVIRLKAAGAISLGKTNTPEFGLTAFTENTVRGSARTPWDTTRSAGGSSGGAAAAVAAGIVPFAHGSDGGGSIRIPASACGIFGLKPSRGRISPAPDANVAGLAVEGPLTRTVRDAAALLDALAGPAPGDSYWAPPLPPGETFLPYTERDPGRLRIARFADLGPDGGSADPDCLAAYEEATRLLVSLGHEVEELPNPFTQGLSRLFFATWAVQSLRMPVREQDEHLLLPVTRWWRARGREIEGERFYAALAGLQTLTRSVVTALQPYDAVLTPTLGLPPQPPEFFAAATEDEVLGLLRRQTLFTPYTGGWNATGQPAASLPLYWNAAGLPIGVTLAGRPAGEAQLLSLCAQLEAARPWSHRRPAVFGLR